MEISNEYYFSRIDGINEPDDYPEITADIKKHAKAVLLDIRQRFGITPIRINTSLEGGINLIYRSKERGIFRKKFNEVFVEICRAKKIIITLMDNKLNIKKVVEVPEDRYDLYVFDSFLEGFEY